MSNIKTKWLREALAKKGKSQKSLADALGRRSRAVGGHIVEGTRRIYLDEIPKIARHLEMPEAELLRRFGLQVPLKKGALDRDLLRLVVEEILRIDRDTGSALDPGDLADVMCHVYSDAIGATDDAGQDRALKGAGTVIRFAAAARRK